jgi:hypothetical protein
MDSNDRDAKLSPGGHEGFDMEDLKNMGTWPEGKVQETIQYLKDLNAGYEWTITDYNTVVVRCNTAEERAWNFAQDLAVAKDVGPWLWIN